MTREHIDIDQDLASEDLLRRIRSAAIGLLARREHSKAELKTKLSQRFPQAFESFYQVLSQLELDGLQSDERFAEAYTRMRHERGYGPARINLELQQRGIAEALVRQCIESSGLDWYLLAESVVAKKYSKGILDFAGKAKAQRFLYYRGFESEHIAEALRDNE